MLVTFKSPAAADVVMFGDIATQLIIYMGQSSRIPGTIIAEDVGSALKRLKDQVSQAQEHNALEMSQSNSDDDSENEPSVDIKSRALPLITLLESALNGESYITWDK